MPANDTGVAPSGEDVGMTPEDLLDLERAHPRRTAAKDQAIRRRGLTPARFYVLLHRAASSRRGLEHDPMTAGRVNRRRAHILPTLAHP